MTDITYARPRSVEEACSLLASHGERAAVVAGGQSLLPMVRAGDASPECLVDIDRLPDRSTVERAGETLVVPCLVRYADLLDSSLVADACPLLADAVAHIGDVQVRNRGTFCGGVAAATPRGDPPTVAAALDATVVTASTAGETRYDAASLVEGPHETVLDPTELVTEVRVPVPGPRRGGGYANYEPAGVSFPVGSVVACLTVADGVVTEPRVFTGAFEHRPRRMAGAEAVLDGETADDPTLAAAADRLAADLDPVPDAEGDAAFKRDLSRTLAERALSDAVAAAGGARTEVSA